MKVIVVHTFYKHFGGEDAVVMNETALLKENGIQIRVVKFFNKSTFLNLIFAAFNPISFLKIIYNVLVFKPDVIHLHNWFFSGSPSVIWAARLMKIPVVMTVHNFRLICPSGILFHDGKVFLDSLHQKFPFNAIKHKVYRNSYVLTLWLSCLLWVNMRLGTWKNINRWVFLNHFSKNIYKRKGLIGHQNFYVKSNFVSSRSQPNLNFRNESFLYVGRLSEEKGIDLILESFMNNKFKLIIIGDGPCRKEVETFAFQNDNVLYLGFLEKKEIERYLASCSALIFPSKCYEGMPMVILEAFSMGLPVIASRHGGIPELIDNGRNGIMFNPGEINDFSYALNCWHFKPSKEKEITSAHAYETFLKKYSSSVNLDHLLKMYTFS